MVVYPMAYEQAVKQKASVLADGLHLRRPHGRTIRHHGLTAETYGKWWAVWHPGTPDWCVEEYWKTVRAKPC